MALPKGLDSLDYITQITGITRSPDHGQGCKFRRCQAEQKIPVRELGACACGALQGFLILCQPRAGISFPTCQLVEGNSELTMHQDQGCS